MVIPVPNENADLHVYVAVDSYEDDTLAWSVVAFPMLGGKSHVSAACITSVCYLIMALWILSHCKPKITAVQQAVARLVFHTYCHTPDVL